MIHTILFTQSPTDFFAETEELLAQYCPTIKIIGQASTLAEIYNSSSDNSPQLVLIELENSEIIKSLSNRQTPDFELVFIANTKEYALEAITYQPAGYLLKPLEPKALITAINKAQKRINFKAEHLRIQHLLTNLSHPETRNNRLSIPTLNGLEFVAIKDLIRLEAMQRCTRLFLKNGQKIVSSTNIGEFKKLLSTYSFFLTHKSHLINFDHIKRYDKDGLISMADGSDVPLSRRQKSAFLEVVRWA